MVETGGGTTAFLLVPLLVLGAGVVFMFIAANDRRETKNRSVTHISSRADHPLRHVQIAMRSAAPKKPRDATGNDKDRKRDRRRPTSGRWLRRI